jgi:small subunit ribosomal protein S4
MSRYVGPRVKRMRSLGVDLPGLSRKSMEKRQNPPGDHGESRRGRKTSDYGRQLKEKQKLRYNYGLGERQMRLLVGKARRSKDETGKKIVELLERRLDNLVFRAGFARTIPAARQLVCHGHIRVDGKKVDIASYTVDVGQVISLRERSQNLGFIEESLNSPALALPECLEIDKTKKTATLKGLPEETPIKDLEIQLVVEFYARVI